MFVKAPIPVLVDFNFLSKQIKINSSISQTIIIKRILLSISLKFLVVVRKMGNKWRILWSCFLNIYNEIPIAVHLARAIITLHVYSLF